VTTQPGSHRGQRVYHRPGVSELFTDDAVAPIADDDAMVRRRAEIGGDGLRDRVARGTIVNTVYLLSMNGLTIVQGLLLAGLLGAGEYGLWGLLTISFGTLFALAAIGLNDKYIQQDHPDQQAAFEIAFTLQSMLCGLFTVIALVAIPLFSVLYDQPRILVPGLLLAFALPLIALQTPIWVFYRRMDFFRQRLLESCSPVVNFVVTVTLALAGVGFWSLVIGALAGAVVATTMAVLNSPYKLRFRYERGAVREYATFSWPLLIGSTSGVLMFQVPITLASRTLGAASIGAITLASQITQYTKRMDDIVTHALYPAICAVKDRRELLFESFSKSNRLALLWGFPAGVAAALFAPTAVPLVLGDGWKLAVPLIQVLGLSAALDQIGFNWTAFARARGETRWLAVASVATLVTVLSVGVPMLLTVGLSGFAVGMGAGTVAGLVVRIAYLSRLFPAASLVSHVAGAIGPTLAAAAGILVERAVLGGDDSALRLALEGTAYVLVVVIATWITARPLLREAIGYVRGGRGAVAGAAT
jgi:O-antigen/teichoic acid export membrane protein